MILGTINCQKLSLNSTDIVADTIDFIEARFVFMSDDWDGLEKWAHFARDSEVYDIRLTDDHIRREDHLNLSSGKWKVYIHGNEFRGGEVIQRVTTNMVTLYVEPTGTLDGEPFPEMPASVTEQILARLEDVEQNGGGGGDGYSPEAKVERVEGGVRVTITDKNGTTSEVVQDGKPGVHVGNDTPPEGTKVWVNPDGERTKIPQVDDTLTKPGYAADAAKVGKQLTDLSKEIADVSGTKKAHEYSGERIVLDRYTFDYKPLFSTVADGVGMQDGCAYGDYYFQFTPNGRFGVYDLRDNSFVGVFALDQYETIVPHCNSASFSNVFYQPEDPFPLAYINAYNNTDLPHGTCYVHRILRDGNTFSTQLVQIIRIGFTDSDMWLSAENETRPYGNFVVDAENKHLYAYTTRDGDKTTRFFMLDLPNVGLIGQSAFAALNYNANEATDDTTLSTSTGLPGTSTTYWATNYIGVGTAVGINVNVQAYRVFCYDSAQNFIGYRDIENKYNDIDFIDGTAYIRVLFHKNYVAFDQAQSVVIRGLLHINSSLGYDPNNAVDEKAISGAEWQDNTQYWITGYIATHGHTSCWFSFRPYKVSYLDSQHAVVGSGYPTENTVSFPEGTAYVIAQYVRTKNTPFETAQSLVVLEAEPIGEEDMEIVLSENDIIERFDVDYFAIPQGCECHNGRLYVTSGWGDASTGSFLHVVDPKTKREVSTIDFYGLLDGEPEAVAVANNRLLYGAGGTMYELLV